MAGDAVTDFEPDRPDLVPLNDAGHELVGPFIHQIKRGAIGLEGFGDFVENQLQNFVEVDGGTEREADLT
jgi:hypothetical protein